MDLCSNNENVFLPNPSSSGHGEILNEAGKCAESDRTYLVIPIAVREEFSMTDATYRSEDCTINVLFSEPKIDNLRLLYCRICTTKQNLKKRFWDRYPEKLPKDGICREELTRNWDNLDLS